jgi:hypothetical protein
MSDIADKIYAATGLTLNADAAAKVGHMIRLARQEAAAEIEKLRAENTKLAASNHAYLSDYQEAADEIEKLRAALRLAVDAIEHWASYASPYFQEKHDLTGDLQELRAALGEKE